MGRRGRPRSVSQGVRCLEHPSSHVISKGKRRLASGVLVRRFTCTPAIGSAHDFSVHVSENGVPPVLVWSPPPSCPRHPDSHVIRWGTYASGTPKRRQRYRCVPDEGAPHCFAPPLPRDHVHEGEDHCEACEDLTRVHNGDAAVARRHGWSSHIVARGLEQLSAGATYADVSRWARSVTGTNRTRGGDRQATAEPEDDPQDRHPGEVDQADVEPAEGGGTTTAGKGMSPGAKEARNTWHISADWVEAFSPVVYEPVNTRLSEWALSERERLDGLIADGRPLPRPQVVLVDDVPVYGQDLNERRKRKDYGYFILVVAEMHWPDPPGGTTAAAEGRPVAKLRLVRAMAKSNTAAWRIVFDELGYAPDFIVADAGTGIAAAIRSHFDPTLTKFIPSLWHLHQAVLEALLRLKGARADDGKLVSDLDRHLRRLGRHSGVLADTEAWSQWWDDLLQLLASRNLPTDQVRKKRASYEAPLAAVLPAVAAHPGIPVSSGGLETLIAKYVKPLLAMRRTAFANIERTNLLMDLVVARQHGAFDNLNEVARLLRSDSQEHGGYTVTLRAISDPRPPQGSYSSLRDLSLLDRIAAERGLL